MIILIYKSPRALLLKTGIPFPFNLNCLPCCVPDGILIFDFPPSIEGTSTVVPSAASENEIGKHEHDKGTLATGNAGSHYHTYNYSIGSDSGSGISDGDAGGGVTTASGGSSTTTADGEDGDHSHALSGNVANNSYSGSQQAMPNIPPYYVVVYLMKLK